MISTDMRLNRVTCGCGGVRRRRRRRRACVVLSRPTLFLHCKRSTLYLHALPQPVLKSHAPSISISSCPRRDCLLASSRARARARERLSSRRNRLYVANLDTLAGDAARLTRNVPRFIVQASKSETNRI